VKEIAKDLVLSTKTILSHRCHIMEKMGLKSDAQIVQYAFRHKMLN
jgi:DNA-binding NarL/FixJ family response regulator